MQSETSRMIRIHSSVSLRHHGGLWRASSQPKEPSGKSRIRGESSLRGKETKQCTLKTTSIPLGGWWTPRDCLQTAWRLHLVILVIVLYSTTHTYPYHWRQYIYIPFYQAYEIELDADIPLIDRRLVFEVVLERICTFSNSNSNCYSVTLYAFRTEAVLYGCLQKYIKPLLTKSWASWENLCKSILQIPT